MEKENSGKELERDIDALYGAPLDDDDDDDEDDSEDEDEEEDEEEE
jgi:hypothetical protein